MIIELDDIFSDVDFSKDATSRNGIETICLSVSRGEHFLMGSRNLISKMEKDECLSITARGVFSWLRSEYSFLAGMLRDFKYRVKIIGAGNIPKKVKEGSWVVPISHIASGGLRPTVLLGENSHDGDLYIHAGHHYRIDSKRKDVMIRVEPRNGNGASVSKELERICREEKEFCLCITDSDKLIPGSNHGIISSATRKVANKSNWVVEHHAPSSRELENALPSELVREIIQKMNFPTSRDFESSANKLGNDAILHADLKFGTSLHWLNSFSKKSPTRIFWEGQAKKVFEDFEKAMDCLEDKKCTSENCSCYIVPRISKDFAKNVSDLMVGDSMPDIFKRAKASYNFDDWIRLGKEVFEAGAGPRPMRM